VGKAKQVQVTTETHANSGCKYPGSNKILPLDLLLSNTDNEDMISEARITDKGRCVDIQVQDVPVVRIVDTTPDITIIEGICSRRLLV